ncbi:UNVERIFIED_CONTAM: hypothetical protein Cloal_1792 [Acetivibrio alkalicellulosi]
MFFKRESKKKDLDILKHFYLNHEKKFLYLHSEKPLKEYFNEFQYEFILKDILQRFLVEKKVCMKVNKGEYFGLFFTGFMDTCGYNNYEILWLNNEKDVLIILFDYLNSAIICSLVNNYTGIWTRDEVIEIYAYDKGTENIKIHQDLSTKREEYEFMLKPSDDGESLSIFLTKDTSFDYIKELISSVLGDYFIKLIVKSGL